MRSRPLTELRTAIVDQWQYWERETEALRRRRSMWHLDFAAAAVLGTTVLVIIALRYYGLSAQASWLTDLLDRLGADGLARRLDRAWNESEHAGFNRRVYWAVFRIVAYVVPVFIVARFVLRRPVRKLGAAIEWRWEHVRIYVVLYLLMLPLLLLASFNGEFQDQYPLYDPGDATLWPRFFIWELLYLGQFLALELFFRGFGVHGLAPRFGAMAIVIMVVPYVAIHLTKPLPEALGSVVAGLVLGFLALRSGTVWYGALLHFSVALTLDVLML